MMIKILIIKKKKDHVDIWVTIKHKFENNLSLIIDTINSAYIYVNTL